MCPSQMLQRVDIFISSPSDVAPEREITIRVIEKLNRLAHIRAKYILFPLAYEREVPPAQGQEAQQVVDQLMGKPQDCYLLTCVLWARMGTPFVHPETNEQWASGTEYEFMTAYRAYERQGEPHILLYRKIQDASSVNLEQKATVDRFFKRFEGETPELKGLYKTYTDLNQFEELLFQHIEKILFEYPPKLTAGQMLRVGEFPKILEETRRLDAAIPRQVSVESSTEVRVKICLPSSQGLRSELPDYTKAGDIIAKKDVRANSLAVGFPLDPSTGKPQPTEIRVEVKAPDFYIDDPNQDIVLRANEDSVTLLFTLTPQIARSRSPIHVLVKQKSVTGTVVTLGAITLATAVKPKGLRLAAQIAWTVLSLPLAAISQATFASSSIVIESQPKPESSTPTTEASISESDALLDGMDSMRWLESLAKRQGANAEELITSADLDIPELPSDTVVDEPGYVEYSVFDGYRQNNEHPAHPQEEAIQPPSMLEPEILQPVEDPRLEFEALDDSLSWLEDLAAESSSSPSDFLFDEPDQLGEALDAELDRKLAEDPSEPDWYTSALTQSQSPSDIEEFPEPAPAAPEPVLAEAAPVEDMPDWLKEQVEEELTPVIDSDMPEWLTEQVEPEAVAIPDWLMEETPIAPIDSADWFVHLPPEPTPESVKSAPEPQFVPPRKPVAPEQPPVPTKLPAVPENALFAQYRQRLEVDPNDHPTRLALARALRVQKELVLSLEQYESLLDVPRLLPEIAQDLSGMVSEYPSAPRLWRLLGDVYMRLGMLQKALDAYRSALDRI